MSADHDSTEQHQHHWAFYVGIGAFLAVVTLIELGPLFRWYNLPVPVLLGLSAMKFFIVVAFFMHLWDDAPIFTRMFAVPAVGASVMVLVLMSLFHGYLPSPQHDSFAVTERHWDIYSQPCSSWLLSHRSHRWYCASPAIDRARMVDVGGGGPDWGTLPINLSAASDADKLAGLIAFGEKVYKGRCAQCHQADGHGAGAYPPLAGSGAFYGGPMQHARIAVHGLNAEIVVQGQTYSGQMPPQGDLKDVELAAVLTYERNSWGNADGMVLPSQVADARAAGPYAP